MVRIAIFASGNGTNAENLIRHFGQKQGVASISVYTNNPNAFVIERARKHGIETKLISKKEFYEGQTLIGLQSSSIDFILLAGFLWLIPASIVQHFKNRMINIHPSLLPKYGGKGMYGKHVHEAVLANGESHSGITIHLVDEEFDRGEILFQHAVQLQPGETVETLEKKIHQLEKKFFPGVVEEYIASYRS